MALSDASWSGIPELARRNFLASRNLGGKCLVESQIAVTGRRRLLCDVQQLAFLTRKFQIAHVFMLGDVGVGSTHSKLAF